MRGGPAHKRHCGEKTLTIHGVEIAIDKKKGPSLGVALFLAACSSRLLAGPATDLGFQPGPRPALSPDCATPRSPTAGPPIETFCPTPSRLASAPERSASGFSKRFRQTVSKRRIPRPRIWWASTHEFWGVLDYEMATSDGRGPGSPARGLPEVASEISKG